MSKISDLVFEYATPVAQRMGFSIYDTEYVKEGSENYLRIYLDKEGGITSNELADFSREMDPILDEKDPIESHYIFEVCSPGVERRLRLPQHFEDALGEKVRVKCYKAVDGAKEHVGTLKGYGEKLVLDEDGKETEFDKANVSICRIVFDF